MFTKKSLLPATNGEHSVSPYPFKTFIPNLFKEVIKSGLIGDAPTIIFWILPPKAFFILDFTIGLKNNGKLSMICFWGFFSKYFFGKEFFKVFKIFACNLSSINGTLKNIFGLYSFKFCAKCL